MVDDVLDHRWVGSSRALAYISLSVGVLPLFIVKTYLSHIRPGRLFSRTISHSLGSFS